MDNSAFSDAGFLTGGGVIPIATIRLSAPEYFDWRRSLYFSYLTMAAATSAATRSSPPESSGNLSTQGDLFFDVQNSADTNDSGTLPGGTIDGNAMVSVVVTGNIVSHSVGRVCGPE